METTFKAGEFKDVKLSTSPSGTVETLLQYVSKAICINFLRRKHETSKKDWIEVTFKLVSQITSLPERSYHGLFIHDTSIILSFMKHLSLKIFCREMYSHRKMSERTVRYLSLQGKGELE